MDIRKQPSLHLLPLLHVRQHHGAQQPPQVRPKTLKSFFLLPQMVWSELSSLVFCILSFSILKCCNVPQLMFFSLNPNFLRTTKPNLKPNQKTNLNQTPAVPTGNLILTIPLTLTPIATPYVNPDPDHSRDPHTNCCARSQLTVYTVQILVAILPSFSTFTECCTCLTSKFSTSV